MTCTLTAHSTLLTAEVRLILKHMGISVKQYLSTELRHKEGGFFDTRLANGSRVTAASRDRNDYAGHHIAICTKSGTILCDLNFTNPRMADQDVGPTVGTNGAGHKLPSSSTTDYAKDST